MFGNRPFSELPATIQDFGVSYEELEPCFNKFERVCGASGKAGNREMFIERDVFLLRFDEYRLS
jgi:hypothetical protein